MNLDIGRITGQVNAFWDSHGQALILAVGLAGLVLVAVGLVKVARSKQRDRWVSGLAAVVVLAWTSEGLWEVARYTLGLPVAFSVMSFFVFEAMMLSSAMQAEAHRRRHGRPGAAGGYVWFLACCTAVIVALNAATVVEALLRFVLPLAAAGLWWVGITAERDSDGEQVRQARAEAAARRVATWAITPRSVLVAIGIMRPGEQTVTDAERERRTRRMVIAAERLQTARPAGWRARRAGARLRRLARRASEAEVAEVRARVRRASGITALVSADVSGEEAHGHRADASGMSGAAVSGSEADMSGPVPARASDARADIATRTPAEARQVSRPRKQASRPVMSGRRQADMGRGTAAERVRTLLAQHPDMSRAELARQADTSERHVRRLLANTAGPDTANGRQATDSSEQ